MSLASDIRESHVPAGSVMLWWLGQAGFLLKSAGGKVLAIDPYLTDTCGAIGKKIGVRMDRLVPPPLLPAELKSDCLALTHSHPDHLDPETFKGIQETGRAISIIAPPETIAALQKLGATDDQMEMTWPNKVHRLGDLEIRTTLGIPMCEDDLTHVGFIVKADGGPTIYFTGDTSYHEILAIQAKPSRPDILVTVINGTFRNMGPGEAARLAHELNVQTVIPCHYGMFADNTLPPDLLRTNLLMFGMADRYRELQCGEGVVLSASNISQT